MKKFFKPTEYFVPEQWSQILTLKNGRGYAFKRSIDVAIELCSRISSLGQVWVDVGCGTGELAYKLSAMGLSVVGVDHDQKMIEFAKKKFLKEPFSNNLNLKFINARAENLPFNNNEIDGIIATSLTGCLSVPQLFFKEAFRILRKDGVAIITFTNQDSILLKINWYLGVLKNFIKKQPMDSENYNIYSPSLVQKELKDIGFKIALIKYYNFCLNFERFLFPPKRLAMFSERISWLGVNRKLGRNFVTVAQK